MYMKHIYIYMRTYIYMHINQPCKLPTSALNFSFILFFAVFLLIFPRRECCRSMTGICGYLLFFVFVSGRKCCHPMTGICGCL